MGLIAYRENLRSLGLRDGFQWIDGSFVEQIEFTRSRPPADVDVLTFARRPAITTEEWVNLTRTNLQLFDNASVKTQFKCDAYFVDLGINPALIVSDTRYWFGLFSHQRGTSLWKGMLTVPLDSDDIEARQMLVQ